MDASRYLTRHGWQGSGHGLGVCSAGISRPLLASRRKAQQGLTIKSSDQWWAKAFDDKLKSLGDGTRSATNIEALQNTCFPGPSFSKLGNLYEGFIRGDGLSGTITTELTRPPAVESGPTPGQENLFPAPESSLAYEGERVLLRPKKNTRREKNRPKTLEKSENLRRLEIMDAILAAEKAEINLLKKNLAAQLETSKSDD